MQRTFTALFALALSTSAGYANVTCPAPLAPAPAFSQTGPYQWIQSDAETTVAFLPNCETVNWQLAQLGDGANEVIANADGTYTLKVAN